jgi:hypothetical protein
MCCGGYHITTNQMKKHLLCELEEALRVFNRQSERMERLLPGTPKPVCMATNRRVLRICVNNINV